MRSGVTSSLFNPSNEETIATQRTQVRIDIKTKTTQFNLSVFTLSIVCGIASIISIESGITWWLGLWDEVGIYLATAFV